VAFGVLLLPVGYFMMLEMSSLEHAHPGHDAGRTARPRDGVYSMMFMAGAVWRLFGGAIADRLGAPVTVAIGGVAAIWAALSSLAILPLIRAEGRRLIVARRAGGRGRRLRGSAYRAQHAQPGVGLTRHASPFRSRALAPSDFASSMVMHFHKNSSTPAATAARERTGMNSGCPPFGGRASVGARWRMAVARSGSRRKPQAELAQDGKRPHVHHEIVVAELAPRSVTKTFGLAVARHFSTASISQGASGFLMSRRASLRGL